MLAFKELIRVLQIGTVQSIFIAHCKLGSLCVLLGFRKYSRVHVAWNQRTFSKGMPLHT